MATTSNRTTDRTVDEEPLRKRARLADQPESNEVCIDLKRLMSYNGEITKPITSDSIPSQSEDAGDSGFQDFTSNDSPASQKNANEDTGDEPTADRPKTTFSSDAKRFSIADGFYSGYESLTNNQNNQNQAVYEEDDNESIISDLSDISCLSDLEDAEKWQSNFGPVSWVQQQITSGMNPRSIIDDLIPNNLIPSRVDNVTLWKILFNILSEPPRRAKLSHVNSLEDVVGLIKNSRKIVVLTGAGISVSSGIPDFRSRDGIYARLSVDFPDLPDPQAMFDINYFRKDQRPFYKFAKEIYPGQFKPSISHKFIKLIESQGKLLRNYTQNIDTLEKSANIERVITCHGSFSTASCTNCKYQVDGSVIKDDIFAQRIPRCPKCPPDCEALCVMKPDIVFFHESLPDDFHNAMAEDKEECDLLIVIGSSLKVKPVALIPTSIPANIPQILINREHLSHMNFDVELLGDCDIIIQELCHRLGAGWNEICVNSKLNELNDHEFQAICSQQQQQQRNRDVGPNKHLEGMPPAIENSSDLSQSSSNGSIDVKRNLADLLPDDSFACFRPASYLFKGAELGYSSDSSDDEEDGDSDEEDEETGNKFANRNEPETYSQESNQMAERLVDNRADFDEPASKTNPMNGHSFPIDTNNS